MITENEDNINNINIPIIDISLIKKRNISEQLGNLEEKYKNSNKKKGESIMEEWLTKENNDKDFDLFIEHFSKINTNDNYNYNDENIKKDNEKSKNKQEKFSKYSKNKNKNSDNKRDLKITNFFNKKRTFSERNEEEKITYNNDNNNDNDNFNVNFNENEKEKEN
jgi:hypothetical protein